MKLKNEKTLEHLMTTELASFNGKIVVLDDDPTGTQTIHDIDIYTNWRKETIEQAFHSTEQLFFILTNSRGLTETETVTLHKAIAETIAEVASETHQKYLIVSRSDSTLRGHFPLETETLCSTLTAKGITIDFEVLCLTYFEGGRITKNDVHYLKKEDKLIPVGETEFAQDNTFGYHSSNLIDYCQEKSAGVISGDQCVSITIDLTNPNEVERIKEKLIQLTGFQKVIVNAENYQELKLFAIALMSALNDGKKAILRTASSLVKVLTNKYNQPLLNNSLVINQANSNGGLVIVGSHVQITTDQLDCLYNQLKGLKFLTFEVSALIQEGSFEKEIREILQQTDYELSQGHTVVVYTSRQVLKSDSGNKEEHLKLSASISKSLTTIVNRLTVTPRFVIAKGGITSSDVATIGLEIQKAHVLGQIASGVSVWDSGEKSKFPHIPFVIFPGNVGNRESLKDVVEKLEAI